MRAQNTREANPFFSFFACGELQTLEVSIYKELI